LRDKVESVYAGPEVIGMNSVPDEIFHQKNGKVSQTCYADHKISLVPARARSNEFQYQYLNRPPFNFDTFVL
jgi:hypothetical protein